MPGPPKNIDDYLKRVTPAQRDALQKLRQQISSLAPRVEECISYSMPAFREPGGHVIAGFLATKQGCSYFPFSGTTLDTLAAELVSYSRTKSGLHFDPAKGLPQSLLRKLLATRRAELAAPTPQQPAKRAAKKKPTVAKQRPAKKAEAAKKTIRQKSRKKSSKRA